MSWSSWEMIQNLKNSNYDNSNRLDFKLCYYLCANKEKLEELRNSRNEVVYGRRGTGKTTLFKAFSHYINHDMANNSICFYVSLDECIPSDIESFGDNTNAVINYSIKALLYELRKFLVTIYPSLPKSLNQSEEKKRAIENKICILTDVIENDAKCVIQEVESSNRTQNESLEDGIGGNVGLTLEKKNLLDFRWKKNRGKKVETVLTSNQTIIKRMDCMKIRERFEDLVHEMGCNPFYICIDEFSEIDRDFSYTVQPKVAQKIKELFFQSKHVCVKIASVWNLSRMQNRQVYGCREGLELGHDIFENNELNLDTMFSNSNEDAVTFFKKYIMNSVMMSSVMKMTKREREIYQEYIIDTIFSQGSLKHLICGSQGIPRIFGTLFHSCLCKLVKKEQEKITVNIVYTSIIEDYKKNVRHSIPYDSPICRAIDKYVTKYHKRFFLISTEDYHNTSNYFDGLVANNALHQCPSEQLPRELRNDYIMFIVHYGNYLESFHGRSTLNEDTVELDSGNLYPELEDDLWVNTKRYVLKIPENALDEMYCTKCKKYFKCGDSSNHGIKICPSCNSIIANWF